MSEGGHKARDDASEESAEDYHPLPWGLGQGEGNGSACRTTEWKATLLDGVMTSKSERANGTPMNAIRNYARNNRGGLSIVWTKDR